MLPSFGARGGLPTGQQFRGNSIASNPELCLLEARQRPQTGVKMAKLSFLKAPSLPPPPPPLPLPLPCSAPPPPPPVPSLPSAAPPVRLWTEIFRVDKSNDVLGNQKAIAKLRKWVQFRVSGQFSTTFPLVAFISGPAGTGKTTVVNNLLREAGAHVQEVNASEERRKEVILELIYGTCTRKPLTGKQASGLVLDEIDGASKEDGNGAIAALLEFVKVADKLPFVSPIICICNDRSNRQLRTLAAKCLDIRFFPLLRKPMEMIAQKIQKRARIYVPESLLKSYITAAGGDVRKLINLLYLRPQNENRLRLHAGDAFSDPFATTRFLLRGTDSLSMLEHLYHQDPDAMALLCQENYPEVCDTLEDFMPWATLFSDVNELEQGWSLTYWDPNDYVGSLLALNARIYTKRRDPNNVVWPKWFEANRKAATQMDTINYDKLVQRCDFRSLSLQQDLMKKRNE